MKLLRLKITDPAGFRSLQPGFEYFFRTEWELQQDDGFAPFANSNFLKMVFLESCEEAGLFSTQQ